MRAPRRQLPRGQLDDERRRSAQRPVLPAGGAAGVARKATEGQPGEAGEAPLGRRVSAPLLDDVERLGGTDRDPRPPAPGQGGGGGGLPPPGGGGGGGLVVAPGGAGAPRAGG